MFTIISRIRENLSPITLIFALMVREKSTRKNKFKSIIGFDVSKEACDINNNDKLYCVSDINLINQNKYDILTMFHVLEHIKNPVEFLKQVMEIDAEYFAVEVPHTNEALVSLYNNKKGF